MTKYFLFIIHLKYSKKKYLTFQRIFSFLKFNYKKKNLEKFIQENERVFEIKKNLLDFTKKNLTTEMLAKYILNCFKEQ